MTRYPPEVPAEVAALLERGHCRAYRFGAAWRVRGPGVDLLIADLHFLRAPDLEPLREDCRARLAHLRGEG